MVFRPISQTHPPTLTQPTATQFAMPSSPTVKPHHKPLHNFPLQDLKWSMNHSNTHRFRNHKPPDCEADRNHQNKSIPNSDKKSKIFIRIRTKTKGPQDADSDAAPLPVPVPGDEGDHTLLPDVRESLPKTWNLRPRRLLTNPPLANGGRAPKIGVPALQEAKGHSPCRSELIRSRNANDANKVNEKKEKEREKDKQKPQKFSIPLTKEEIEEDIYSLTGSKPARRPKKRAKLVQKQLDCVFPGLWLASITPDSYRVPDAPSKGLRIC